MSWDDPENYEPELDEDHLPGPEDDPSVQELQPQLLLSSTLIQSRYFTNLNLRCDSKTVTSIG